MKSLSIFLIVILSFYFIRSDEEIFNKVMNDLEDLESYIKEYITEKSITQSSLTHLIVCYIRLGAYSSSEWQIAGGQIPNDLAEYISSKDEENETTAKKTQTYRDIVTPNGDKIDFVHMFAVMNGIEYGNSYTDNFAHLVGWGGDTEQLVLEDIMEKSGDLESLMELAKNNFFRIKGGFDESDLISDLDAPIILSNKNDHNNFADLMRNYYTNNDNSNRVNKFIQLTFPNLVHKVDKETFRNELYNKYTNDFYIRVLECKKGMREKGFLGCYFPSNIKNEYSQKQKAAVYVVSDYLFENYKIITETKTEEKQNQKEEEKEEEEIIKDQDEEEKKDEKPEEKKDIEKTEEKKDDEKTDEKKDEKEKEKQKDNLDIHSDKGEEGKNEIGVEVNDKVDKNKKQDVSSLINYDSDKFLSDNFIYLLLIFECFF